MERRATGEEQELNRVPGTLYYMCSEEKAVIGEWSIQQRVFGERGLKVDHEGGQVLDEKVRIVDSMDNERAWVQQRTPGALACPASLLPFGKLNYSLSVAFRLVGNASQGALSSQDKKWMGDPSYAGKKHSYQDITWSTQRITVEMMNLDARTVNRLSLGSCYVGLQNFRDFLIF